MKNIWKYSSQMENPLGLYGTNYKVIKVENLLFWEIEPPSDLLSQEWSYCGTYACTKAKIGTEWVWGLSDLI